MSREINIGDLYISKIDGCMGVAIGTSFPHTHIVNSIILVFCDDSNKKLIGKTYHQPKNTFLHYWEKLR